LRAFDQRRIAGANQKQLVESDPRQPTRNKFALEPTSEFADYELRAGYFRVFYRVEETDAESRVIVAIVGKKVRDKLIVEGEEFEL
jgi:hypothetical protein